MDELAQKLASLRDGVAPPWSEERRERVYMGVARLRRRQRARRVGACAGAAALAVCGFTWLRLPPSSGGGWASAAVQATSAIGAGIRNQPSAGPLEANTHPANSTSVTSADATDMRVLPTARGKRLLAGARALLADGSTVEVTSSNGELFVAGNQPEDIQLRLVAGAAHFDVVPNRERQFSVAAGSVEVVVVGTAFDVEQAKGRVRVAVSHGKVRVLTLGGEAFIQAGESRWFEQGSVPTADAQAAAGVARVAKSHASRGSHEVSRDETPPRLDWRSLNNSGDYARAFELLAQGAPVEDEAEALMDAADAARLSNHPEVAARYLGRVLTDHRGSPSTPLAAFTLGRLLLERLARPSEAAEAFAAARDLAPRGSLAQDALAREVEAWSKAGRSEEAYRRAHVFVQSYPESRRVPAVEQYGGLRAP